MNTGVLDFELGNFESKSSVLAGDKRIFMLRGLFTNIEYTLLNHKKIDLLAVGRVKHCFYFFAYVLFCPYFEFTFAMRKRFALSVLFTLIFCGAFSQNVALFPICNPGSISLGNDVTFCSGDSVTFTANGTYDRFVWNTGASGPSLKVKTSGTYIVHGLKSATVELINNGNFNTNTVNFTSDYTNAVGNLQYDVISQPNYYKIVPKTDDAYWDFTNTCMDHTSANLSSNMLAVNGYKLSTTKKIWCQTVAVNANQNYTLSAWAATMGKDGIANINPAKLQFKINNVVVGSTLNLTTTTCDWKNFTNTWASGVNTSAQVCIYDIYNDLNGNGNDFAIDDISLKTVDTCRVSDTVVVIVNPKPVVNLGNDVSTCSGASVALTVPNTQPSWTYFWSTSETTNPISVSASGTYSVTVTDNKGCTGNDNIGVTFNNNSTISLGNDISQCGGSVNLDAGAGFTTYAWSGVKTGSGQTMLADVSGQYIVSASNGSCNAKDTINVNLYSLPTVNLGPDQTSCTGNVVVKAGPNFASYLWSNAISGPIDSNITVNSSSSVWVEVTNNNNCKDRDTMQVNIVNNLVINLGNDTNVCGTSLLLDAGAGLSSYTWSGIKSGSGRTMLADVSGEYIIDASSGSCSDIDTINVTLHSLPTVNLGNDQSTCSGNIILHAGPTFSSYLWSDATTDSTLTSSGQGTYWVEVSDNFQCKDRDTVIVTSANVPVINLGADVSVCAGVVTNLNAGSGFTSYTWSGAKSGTSQSIIADVTGVYYVEGMLGGCFARDTINIAINSLPTANIGNDQTLCTGGTANFNAGSFTSYLWSDASTNSTFSTNISGTYWVEVTDNKGCKDRDSAVVTVVNSLVLNIGGNKSICNGASIVLNAGSGFVSYAWTGVKTGSAQNITADIAGKYKVVVTAAGGCTAADSMTLSFYPVPVVSLGNDVNVCEGSTATITATAGFNSYLWSTGESTASITKGQGTYNVQVRDANNCGAKDTIILTSVSLPQVNIGNDVVACDGVTQTFQDNINQAGVTYSWTAQSSGAVLGTASSQDVYTSDKYILTATDPNNCKASDTAEATFLALPNAEILNVVDTTVICEGNNKILKATDFGQNITYFWTYSKETTQSVNAKTTGWYQVIVYNGYCTDTDAIYLRVVSLPKTALNDTVNIIQPNYCFIEETNGVVLDASSNDGINYNYLWSTGETTSSIIINAEGTYSVNLEVDGCTASDKIKIIDYCPTKVFIPNAFTPNNDAKNDLFKARGEYVEDFEMYIFNRWGELIFHGNGLSTGWDGTYGGVRVQQDVYVYKVSYKSNEPNGVDAAHEELGKVVVVY